MKLRTKLISIFTFVITLLLIIGITSQFFTSTIKNKVIAESQGAVRDLEISAEIESYLYRSFINAHHFLDEPYRATLDQSLQDSLLSTENIRRKVQIALQGLNFNLRKIQRQFNREGHSDLDALSRDKKNFVTLAQLESEIMFYNSLIEQLLSYEEEDFEDAKNLLTVTIEPYYRNKLLPLVEQFRNQTSTNLDVQKSRLNNRLTNYSNILMGATVFAFLVSIVLAYQLYKSITNPIHSLAQAAEEIGHGNLEKRIEVKSNDEIGQLGSAFNRMAENLNKITFTKEYVDDIIDSMGDALIVTNNQLKISKTNSASLKMLGYSQKELIGQSIEHVFSGGNHAILLSTDEYAIVENHEIYFKHKAGTIFPVSLSKAIIHKGDGSVQGLVFVISDITERKESERLIKDSLKEKEVLLAEIHHRVKNNLAVISGLLQMQRWESVDEVAQQVLQDSQLRVKSIALVHEKLYQSENLSSIAFDQYVEELIAGINKTFNNSKTDITFDIDVEALSFSVNQAIPCSLLLNELIVNVHKHAFKDLKEGKVIVRLWEEAQKVHLLVKDNGCGLEDLSGEKTKKSLGMSLVHTLVNQLGGEMEALNDQGATFKIIFERDEIE